MTVLRLHAIVSLLCLAVLAATVVALVTDSQRDWQWYRAELVRRTASDLAAMAEGGAAALRRGELAAALERLTADAANLQQIWVPDLGQLSRCPTCHAAAIDSRLARLEFPYKKHPEPYLDVTWHPPEQYGCLVCHGGSGRATTADDAHGTEATSVTPRRKDEYAQANCGRCHQAREVEAAPALALGRWLAEDLLCAGCHDLGQDAPQVRLAPLLARLSAKTSRDWLLAWFVNPAAYRPRTRMPRPQLRPGEILLVADYLLSLPSGADESSEADLRRYAAPGLVRLGRELATGEAACITCHEFPNIRPPGEYLVPGRRLLGPDVADMGDKLRPDYVARLLADPQQVMPGTPMPRFGLDEKERDALAAFVVSFRRRTGRRPASASGRRPTAATPVDAEQALNVMRLHGCAACHDVPGLDRRDRTGPSLADVGDRKPYELDWSRSDLPAESRHLIGYLLAKLERPGEFPGPTSGVQRTAEDDRQLVERLLGPAGRRGGDSGESAPADGGDESTRLRMPTFRLTDAQRRCVVTFLLSRSAVALPEKFMVPDPQPPPRQIGGQFALLDEHYRCTSCHAVGGRGGNIAPVLDGAGSKLRSDWLRRHLRSPERVHFIWQARMPRMGLADGEVETLAAVLEQACVDERVVRAARLEPGGEDATDGLVLFQSGGQGRPGAVTPCIACHRFGDETGGISGPDLAMSRDRLRPEWLVTWLREGRRLVPGTRMPTVDLSEDQARPLAAFLLGGAAPSPPRSDEGGRGR